MVTLTDNRRSLRLMIWHIGLIAVALAATLLLTRAAIDPPRGDLILLGSLMAASGTVTAVLGHLAIRFSRNIGRGGLRARLVSITVLGLGTASVNIIFTAYLMFISRHDLTILAALLLFSLAVAVPLALLMGRTLSTSVENLVAAASAIAAGDLQVRVPDQGSDELTDLTRTFNAMATRLQASIQRQQELEQARRTLVAAVSHDLHTPLASLRATVEALLDGVVTDRPTMERYLHNIHGEAQRLSALIDDLFELSQIDAGALRLSPEETSIADLLSDTLEGMSAQAHRKHIALSGAVPPDLPSTVADPQKIQRVLYNLMQNALRHTPADGTITVQAAVSGDAIAVTVADTCDGIGGEDLPYVFEPFYRGDKSRQRDGSGAGLGLSIAKAIVEAHGGRIWCENAAPAGCRFRFTLPNRVA
ncbi:MAG: sensor histidine kinase [Dehalococcoidia bacterium]